MSWTIFVLLLANNKFYIGTTQNETTLSSINDIVNFNASNVKWTNIHTPEKIIELFSSNGLFPRQNDIITKKYMFDYGIENVRGGSYSNINLNKCQIEGLEREFISLNGYKSKIIEPIGDYLAKFYNKYDIKKEVNRLFTIIDSIVKLNNQLREQGYFLHESDKNNKNEEQFINTCPSDNRILFDIGYLDIMIEYDSFLEENYHIIKQNFQSIDNFFIHGFDEAIRICEQLGHGIGSRFDDIYANSYNKFCLDLIKHRFAYNLHTSIQELNRVQIRAEFENLDKIESRVFGKPHNENSKRSLILLLNNGEIIKPSIQLLIKLNEITEIHNKLDVIIGKELSVNLINKKIFALLEKKGEDLVEGQVQML